MKIDLLGGTSKEKYPDISVQRSINWMPVTYSSNEKAKNQTSLVPTPGLTLFCNITGRYHRGCTVARTMLFSRAFCVVDKTLWEIFINGSVINRGTLTNIAYGYSPVILKVNENDQLFIGHYTAGYVFDMETNILTQITDPNYPGKIVSADYIDGYGFVVANGRVYFSVAGSWLNWTGVDGQQTYHPTFKSAPTVAVVAYRDKIFNFSTETIEPYYEDGSTAIWARYPGNILYTGALHSRLTSVYDTGIVFCGKSQAGQTNIYILTSEFTGLSPISQENQALQWQINSRTDALNDAWSYIQKNKEGHELYILHIPAFKTTYCYDLTNQQWFEKQSLNPSLNSDGTMDYNIYRGKYFISFGDLNLFMDYYSGAIFIEDYTNQTENNILIKRERISQTASEEDFKLISLESVEIDATKAPGSTSGQGKNPVLMFSVSVDGGRTFTAPRNLKMGLQGNYLYRTKLLKLGSGRNWVVKMVLTDPIDLMIQNAYANGIIGQY